MAIIAGFSSLLLVSRLRDYVLDAQTVAIIGGGNFLFAWFLVGGIVRRVTVHRGMCHSIPMAIITGEIAFLLSSGGINERLYCGVAAGIGVLVHLLLDEFYSVQFKRGTVRVKKSLGSALKLVNFEDKGASLVMFVILGFFTFLSFQEPVWSKNFPEVGTPEHKRQLGKDELREIQNNSSEIYDLSVVQWAADNNMQLRPRGQNNRKWLELTNLLSSPTESEGQGSGGTAVRYDPDRGPSILEMLSSNDGADESGIPPGSVPSGTDDGSSRFFRFRR
jgi:membrane-bound metal-dependent hydrolase YbcI (DUF457 family)